MKTQEEKRDKWKEDYQKNKKTILSNQKKRIEKKKANGWSWWESYGKNYYQKHKSEIKEKQKEYQKEYQKIYRKKHKKDRLEYNKNYLQNHKEELKKKRQIDYQNNKEKRNQTAIKWQKDNIINYRIYQKNFQKEYRRRIKNKKED